ncbi:MAG: hypothetical protein SPJ13_07040 [Bacteroidales bacterium]|nr:hypothetical protein [Bacteroidales bacterium]
MKTCNILLLRRSLLLACAALAVAVAAGCSAGKDVSPSRSGRQIVAERTPEELALQNMLVDAKTQQANGATAEAEKTLRALLAKNATNDAACYEMARLMAGAQRMDSAVLYVERAKALNPQNVWYRLLAATLYQAMGQADKQAREWEAVVELRPDEEEYYYELSNAYAKAGKETKAVEALNRLERMIGVSEPLSLQKQRLWLNAGREKEAIAELEALAKARPKEKKYNSMLAETYMKVGNLKKAKYYYDQVLANDPDDEFVHISLAQYYKVAGDDEQAYRELKKGFANPALDCKTKMRLLMTFYTKEEFFVTHAQYVYDLLGPAMNQCEDSVEFTLYYGELLMNQRRYAAAAEKLKETIARDSSKYEIWESLLVCLANSDTVGNETALYARRAQALFPMHNLPYYLTALDAYRKKDYEEAVKQLSQSEKAGFTNGYLESQTYGLLAESYHKLGQNDKVFAYFDKMLDLNPNDTLTLNNYAYYLAVSGTRLEQALQMIEQALKWKPGDISFLDTYAWVLFKMGRYKEAREQMEKCLKLEKNPSETLREHWKAILEKSHD